MSFPLLTVGQGEVAENEAKLLLGRPYDIRPSPTPSSVPLEKQFFVEWEVAEAN